MNSTNLIEDLRLLSPPDYRAWWAVAVLVLAAAGVLVVIRIWRRRSRINTAPGDDAGAPSWDLALVELERLTSLLQQERSRDYGIVSTGILRRYIEARYALRAPKLATEEFLMLSRESPTIPEVHRASLRRYLEWCDLLKFGRYVAATSELVSLHEAAVSFVLASRPVDAGGLAPRAPTVTIAAAKPE